MPWTDELPATVIDEKKVVWARGTCPNCGTVPKVVLSSTSRRTLDCQACGRTLVTEVSRFFREL